jgi:hypothetical protein
MGMSPRLLRPILSGDPDALRYIAAVQQADGESLEPAVRKAFTDFIVGCKQDGTWSAIKASCIMMGARSLAGALTPLAGTAPTNFSNNFVSGDYSRTTGLKGNRNNKYLNSNRDTLADGQDDHHASIYLTEKESTPAGARNYFHDGASSSPTFLASFSDTQAATRSRAASSSFPSIHAVGFLGITRSSSTQYQNRGNGTTNTVSTNSGTPNTTNMAIFATPAGAGSTDARIAFYSIGSSLDLATLDARVSALYTAIGAALS